MRPSWHNDSSGSSPQLTLLSLFDLPREYESCEAQGGLRKLRPKAELTCEEAQTPSFVGVLWASWVEPAWGGHQNELKFRMSLLMSGASSETWKALEEDLNQRFLAFRSPTVRSHCATNPTAQSHVGLTQGSAWSVGAMINNTFLLPLWDFPTVTLSPSTLDPPSNTGSESCSNPFPSLWLTVLPQVRSPDHRCHFSIPPPHPTPSPLSPSSYIEMI